MMGSKSDQFINDLVQFYRNKGHNNPQPKQFIARINGKVVDLNQLYSYVIESGGSFKVNQLNLWDDIYCKLFKTSVVGANISVALRQIYARYLLPYEKVFSTNFGNDLLDDDEDESNFSFNSSHNHNHNHSFNSQNTSFSVPSLSYHLSQQSVSTTTVTESRNPLNKLFCSLLSGLPNELDFALKVSTILTNSNRFDWISDHKFIDLLLECSKNYCCLCDQQNDFQDYYVDKSDSIINYEQNECNCYQKFWYQCCSDEQTLELVFGSPDPNIEELSEQDFNKVEERIRLIADIIRNLSFTYDSESVETMSVSNGCIASNLLMKFLLLLSNSSLQPFNYIAFDIISNIAPITAVITEDNDYKQIQQNLHRRCVEIAMTSNDIHWTSRSLEIVSRLFSSNIEEINNFLELQLKEYEVFVRITHLITCQYDITLLLAILEFCLSLSQQRPHLLVKDDNKHLIKMLLTLLNCEASQHFSTTALKKMRVIDDRPRTQTNQNSESNSGQTVTVVNSGQNTSSQNNNIDNETFAMNWLRTAYEPIVNLNENQSLKASDVYADYVKQCCRSSRRNVMAAQPFSQLLKRCFPSSSLTNNQTTIEGIVAKSVQNKSNGIPAPQLMSPILKAHLSAPPKNSNSSTPTVNTSTNCSNNLIINSTTNPTTSVQSIISTTCVTLSSNSLSIPTTNTSTLIKSLLANKLRSNATITTSSNALGTTIATMTTSNPTTSTIVTPTKSTNNMSVKVTPVAKPVPITNTIDSGINATNGESIGNNSPQLPSAITITPSVSSVSLTPNNTIISSNATLTGQTIQPQQQFLLVRTIITSPGQQQSGSSLTSSGTPVRLILPASMLTQQRLNPPTVNGIATTSTTLSNVTLSATNSLTFSNASTTVSSSTSDLFLKTVLSNSNSSANSVPPLRSNVKSSPLLNVLLDKGKLPEFSTTAVMNNQMTGLSNSGTTLMASQTPKMYILTTKSPLAIKSLPTLQTQQLNQTAQCLQQTQLSPVCTLQTQNSTTLKACLQNSSLVVANTTNTNTSSSITVTTATNSNHTVVNKQLSPKTCVTPLVNGDIGPPVHSSNIVVNSVNPINNNINAVNYVNDSNSGQTSLSNSLNPINSIPSSDLSSFKDIKKAVDDATRLLAKRPNENADSIGSNKKLKINSVLTIPCSGVATHNSIPNHDSNSVDLNSIPNNNLTNNSQQVLTKASTLSTTSTTPSTVVTTITTINSNDIKNVCNNNNNNISNKENNSSVSSDFECQWNDCKKTFSRASEVFLHVHNHHIMPSTFPNIMTCLWGGQEGTGPGCLSKRPKFSLLTHLLDFHCNPNVLQQESVRKRQLSSVGSTAITLPQPPAHPGYAHNAALLAIKRHATNYVEAPTLPPVNDLTPLTVSIRLTCALILRNLTLHSNFVKRTLECFEQYLCELCMSDGRDESRTIAQCLALINDQN